MWIDTSSGPPFQLKVWDATSGAWQNVGGTGGGGGGGTTAQTVLGAAVTMTSANTYYSGPAVTLTAGTWLVWAQASVGIASISDVSARIWDGTTSYASGGEVTRAAAIGVVTIALVRLVVLSGTTTLTLQAAADNAGGSLVAALGVNAAGNTATAICAYKVA